MVRPLVYFGEVPRDSLICSTLLVDDLDFTPVISTSHPGYNRMVAFDSQHLVSQLVKLLQLVLSHKLGEVLDIPDLIKLCS